MNFTFSTTILTLIAMSEAARDFGKKHRKTFDFSEKNFLFYLITRGKTQMT